MSKTPNKQKDYVKLFCRSVVLNAKPVYVPYMPVLHAKQQECFETVSRQIMKVVKWFMGGKSMK